MSERERAGTNDRGPGTRAKSESERFMRAICESKRFMRFRTRNTSIRPIDPLALIANALINVQHSDVIMGSEYDAN